MLVRRRAEKGRDTRRCKHRRTATIVRRGSIHASDLRALKAALGGARPPHVWGPSLTFPALQRVRARLVRPQHVLRRWPSAPPCGSARRPFRRTKASLPTTRNGCSQAPSSLTGAARPGRVVHRSRARAGELSTPAQVGWTVSCAPSRGFGCDGYGNEAEDGMEAPSGRPQARVLAAPALRLTSRLPWCAGHWVRIEGAPLAHWPRFYNATVNHIRGTNSLGHGSLPLAPPRTADRAHGLSQAGCPLDPYPWCRDVLQALVFGG